MGPRTTLKWRLKKLMKAGIGRQNYLRRKHTVPKSSLQDLYVDELRDLYNAETQLVKALPKMAKTAANDQLRQAFEEHLRQTSEHVSRLEQIFEQLGEKPSGKRCVGMEGLVKEGSETMKQDYPE